MRKTLNVHMVTKTTSKMAENFFLSKMYLRCSFHSLVGVLCANIKEGFAQNLIKILLSHHHFH